MTAKKATPPPAAKMASPPPTALKKKKKNAPPPLVAPTKKAATSTPPPPPSPAAAAPPLPPIIFRYQRAEGFTLDGLRALLERHDTVGVHFEMTDDPSDPSGQQRHLALVALVWGSSSMPGSGDGAESEKPWIIHQHGEPAKPLVTLMAELLANDRITKVCHDIHAVAQWFHGNALDTDKTMVFNKCLDLQLYHEAAINHEMRTASMAVIARECSGLAGVQLSTFKDLFVQEYDKKDLAKQLIPHKVLQSMVKKASLLVACYKAIGHKNCDGNKDLLAMTCRRWRYASLNHGRSPTCWFDVDQNYLLRSLECLGTEPEIHKIVPMLELECEIDSLIALLPTHFRESILSLDDAQNKLVDVCLDVKRVPHAYVGPGQRVVLRGQSEGTVTESDITHILGQLGGETKIGGDNRAGVDRQLHRISVMRSKTDEIYGITMRVGRTLQFASNYLLDLLMSPKHKTKSVLLLGRPGSGKTTLIRDIARCISESGENVCIIDTSNEIGGDGVAPHECIGWARRMMVKSLNDQAHVMVECVQNHTVETLIVDEIGRKAEVDAAGTVRQRGPRIIASAHGDFRSLIKNQDLKGLIGGVQSVTVGDAEAQKKSHLGKVQAKRSGNPIFDVIVEIDEVCRGKCRIIWDVAQAVDDVLEGNAAFKFETRFQTLGMRGVQVLTP